MRSPRVVYWNSIPSPYVVGRFNALVRRGNLNFEAWFNEEREPDRSWIVNEEEWHFRGRYLPRGRAVGGRLQLPLAQLRDARPDLLVSLYASASFALGSFAASAMGVRVAYRVLPTFNTWTKRSPWKELLKRFLFRAVDGVKVPGPDGARMARRYGVPRDRIHQVRQSVDVEHYRRALDVTPASRADQRQRLGLQGCVFLYVGRLWSGKGLDYLFDAYRRVRRERDDISLLLVGDGIDEAQYRALAHNLPNVAFAGFIQPRDLPSYYALADVLVLPTLGDPHGLVVEEAMAAGLPVICTEAAGDIRQRLPEGRAGFVVPPADATRLADRMILLAADAAMRTRLGAEGQERASGYAHDQWAADFEAFVERILSMPRRRTLQATFARAAGFSILAGTKGSPAPSRRRAKFRRPQSPSS